MPSASLATSPVIDRPAPWLGELLAALPAPAGALAAQQSLARTQLAGGSLPDRRQEAWRFTPLDALRALDPASLVRPPALAAAGDPVLGSGWPPPAADALRLVVDGQGDPFAGATLPAGLEPLSGEALRAALGQALQRCGCDHDWPPLLNQAVGAPPLALRVTAAAPVRLELIGDAAGAGLLALRLLLVLEPGADLELLHVQRSRAGSLTSLVLEADLAAGSRLRHGFLATGHREAVLLAHHAILQAPGSELELSCASGGWGLARLEPRVLQTQGAALTRLRGLHCVAEGALADTHSLVRFEGPEGKLDQLHKVVADGNGHSVFNGAVQVPRQAQRTDASQLSRALLLSERACVDTKPELAIVADDVRCAHGATISRLQDDELFYLCSRGIDADRAARLLLRGWCEEVLRTLPAAAASWQPLEMLLGEASPR
ncbi:MAG: SufD family Fe-S cluster assembly protein [Synechococcaceae cyanobacterium]